MQSKLTPAQILLGLHLKELGMRPEYEVRVCEDRQWRFDVICRDQRLAFELDGWHKGKHGAGWGADHEKQNRATLSGWRLLRFSNRAVLTGKAKQFLREYL